MQGAYQPDVRSIIGGDGDKFVSGGSVAIR